MIKKFEVRNYKNFNGTLCINFSDVSGYTFNSDCIIDGLIGKMLIYGRNATGKTNLGEALQDIFIMMNSLSVQQDAVLNADTDSNEIFFAYTFLFENDEILYEYTKSEDDILMTEMLMLNNELIYKLDYVEGSMMEEHLDKLGEGPILFEKFVSSLKEDTIESGRMPFLRWIAGNIAFSNKTHIASMIEFVNRMQFVSAQSANSVRRGRFLSDRFYPLLENPQELERFELFLNSMGVPCELVLEKLPNGQNELYFKHKTLVPFFDTASSGTRALVELYRRIFVFEKDPTFIYLDEFDAFYHYEMSEKMILYLKDNYPRTQVIMTTHNTGLMSNSIFRPDCLFILSGYCRITSIVHATMRELREGHNLEKMYKAGEFACYE